MLELHLYREYTAAFELNLGVNNQPATITVFWKLPQTRLRFQQISLDIPALNMTLATNYTEAPNAQDEKSGMSRAEIRSSSSLAAIFALRMLGLFMLSPVFAIYAKNLSGGNNPLMVGLALGMFSLVQAFFQIPLGMASDRLGRKPVIVAGMLIFAVFVQSL